MTALLDTIAIAILISVLPRLVVIAALIVIIIIIPLRACQSAEHECHHGQKCRKFDLSRHDFGPSDPVLIFSYFVGCVRNFDLMLRKLFPS
jgi:hypothetical protein